MPRTDVQDSAATETAEPQIPEDDFEAFQAFRDSQDSGEPPAAGDAAQPTSEATEEAQAAETAAALETAEVTEETPEDKEKKGISRRFHKLTAKITQLEEELKELKGDAIDEETTETAAPPAAPPAATTKLVAPKLADFETFEEYEAAKDQYHEQVLEQRLAEQKAELARQQAQQEQERQKAAAQDEWNRQASRYPDFNEVVTDECKISTAMEAVMRMDPETGTALAYYLGQHPEESEQIARSTLATNEEQWRAALARAGVALGAIKAKLPPPGKAAPKTPATSSAAPPRPQVKQVSSASKPPTTLRSSGATPAFDVHDEASASDYKKWQRAREAQLKRK